MQHRANSDDNHKRSIYILEIKNPFQTDVLFIRPMIKYLVERRVDNVIAHI